MVNALPGAPRDGKKRHTDHLWTTIEDNLLKTLADRYPNNWPLVAEAFNSSRLTISIDRRTPYDCYERWNQRFNPSNGKPGEASSSAIPDISAPTTGTSASAPPLQMTTRGVKRLTSVSMNGANPGVAGTGEGKRRRRHGLVLEAIRKSLKKKDANTKAAAAAQQKKAAGAEGTNMHSTHELVQKLQPLTPLELSRIKADREAKDQQELLMARRRHEELTRQNMLAHRQQQIAAQHQAQQAQLQKQQQQAQQQHQPGQAGPSQPQAAQQPAQQPQAAQQQVPQQVQMPQQAVTAMVNALLSHDGGARFNNP